jgi:alginate O-acetyltransferase complex protein AlgI
VPLGGNRKGGLVTYRNLFLTMLIGGLWHGAAMTFVVWGGLHGLYLAAERRFTRAAREPAGSGGREQDIRRPWSLRDLPRTFLTFQLVCLAWVFFRAESLSAALHYLGRIVRLEGGATDRTAVALLAVGAAASFLLDYAQHRTRDHTPMLRWNPALRGLAYGLMLVPIIIFSGGTPVPFIYFEF